MKNKTARLIGNKLISIGQRVTGRKYTYWQDGLATFHNCDFMREPHFMKAYAAGEQTGSWGGSAIHWRAFVACWAAQKGASLEGDFVECGVNKGGLAATVCEYVSFKKLSKQFYLLDTYCGLVDRYISSEEKARGIKEGGYEECFDAVSRTFSNYSNVELIKGSVPDTLQNVPSKKVAYLSIDMNCVEPEIAAAEFFWDKLSSGAVMVLDDYGWSRHISQKKAFDKFAQDRGVLVLPLPTGQGLIIKP
ncbi:MAG: class I SAM-dependent methyltransferase [Candidatus Electrothrix sp. AW2]|nr:class I SAM-dependent methyltransferase [Candidatus Electrothrix gigas]